jgi:hypothetical protein
MEIIYLIIHIHPYITQLALIILIYIYIYIYIYNIIHIHPYITSCARPRGRAPPSPPFAPGTDARTHARTRTHAGAHHYYINDTCVCACVRVCARVCVCVCARARAYVCVCEHRDSAGKIQFAPGARSESLGRCDDLMDKIIREYISTHERNRPKR